MRSKWLVVLFALLVALQLSAQMVAGQETQPPVAEAEEAPAPESPPAEQPAAPEPAPEAQAEPEPEPEPAPPVVAAPEAVSSLAVRTQALELPYLFGAGSFFSDESTTFSGDALFLSAMWHGVHPPGVPPELDVTAGTRVEIGKSTLSAETFNDVNVRVYSSNRVRVASIITGMDFKILDSGGWDFDTLLVGGYVVTKHVEFEVYFLEEQRPIAWAVHYRF